MYRLITAIGVAAVAACLAAGCGSSSNDATSAPLTKTQFIKQADALCTKATKEREAAADAWRKELPGGPEEAAEKFEEGLKEVIAPALQHQAEELEALTPPGSDRATVDRMISTLTEASEAMEAEPKKALQTSVPQFEREAKKYGLKRCPQML